MVNGQVFVLHLGYLHVNHPLTVPLHLTTCVSLSLAVPLSAIYALQIATKVHIHVDKCIT